MDGYTSTTWGYKVISDRLINFYHILLPKISMGDLYGTLPHIDYIQKQSDNSITIAINSPLYLPSVIHEVINYFDKVSQEYLETPNYYYKIDQSARQTLFSWALSFEGCLALMLALDEKIIPFIDPKWQLVNSGVGGIFLNPFTLFLYADHPKILHPITLQNREARQLIEQATATLIRKIVKRVEESQPGLEGQALLSLVESKTNLPGKRICSLINEKAFGVQNPVHSTFFTSAT